MSLGGGFGISKSGGGSGMSSGLTYKGTWNADTNTPTLGNGGAGGVQGDYYIVSVAGNTSLDGESDWGVGDWVVNNGSEWQKIDNSEPPTIYRNNSTVGTSRVATLTDTLTWTGGTVKNVYASGGATITQGTGTNPLGFGVSHGSGALLNTPNQWDSFQEMYYDGTNPVYQVSIYDNTTFLENACFGLGTGDLGSGTKPYGFLYYTPDNASFIGFEANEIGERLYSQLGGLTETAMNSTDRVLFVNGSGVNGTGYMRAATFASLAARLPTLYTGNSSLTSNRIVTGGGFSFQSTGTSTYDITSTTSVKITASTPSVTIDLNAAQGFRAFSSTQASVVATTGAINLSAGTNVVVQATALQMVGDISIGATGVTQQQLIFKDLGGTAFDGTLQNKDLTAARTWELPDASGTIALLENTFYEGDGSIVGNRTVTGDESLIQFTNTNFRAQAADGAFLFVNADESTLNGASVFITGTELLLQSQDTYLAQAATEQQSLTFRDLGATPFDGVLQNANLTAARTWTLPDSSGTIALISDITLSSVLAQGNTTGANDISIDSGQSIIYNNGGNTSTISTLALTGNQTINFPNASGTLVLGSGTTDFVARWNAGALTTGLLRDNGTNVSAGVAPSATRTMRIRAGAGDTTTASFEHTTAIAGVTYAMLALNSGASTQTIGGSLEAFASAAGGISVGGRLLSNGVCTYPTGFTAIGGVAYSDVNTGNTGDALAFFACADASHVDDNYGLIIDVVNAGAGGAFIGRFTDGTEGVGKVLTSDANGVATWQSLPPTAIAITTNRVPKGTGTNITDSLWETVTNASASEDLRPTASGGNLGGTAAANRISTIYMASTIDHTGVLGFQSTAGLTQRFLANGSVELNRLGGGVVNIGNPSSTSQKVNIAETLSVNRAGGGTANIVSQNSNGGAQIQAAASNGAAGMIISVSAGAFDSTLSFRYLGTTRTIMGYDASDDFFRMGTTTLTGGTTWLENDFGTSKTTLFNQTTINSTLLQYDAQLTVRGANTLAGTTNNVALFAGGNSGLGGLYAYNDGGVSVGNRKTNTITKFEVFGSGATSATVTARFNDSGSVPHYLLRDDGVSAFGAGISASFGFNGGIIQRTQGFSYGTFIVGVSNSTAAMIATPYGTTRWGAYFLVDNNNTFASQSVGAYARNISTTGSDHRGFVGDARNGTSTSIGVTGESIQGATVASSQYVAGVLGRSLSNLDNRQYAGIFNAAYNDATTTYTKDLVGVYGYAIATTGDAGSTGDVYGGWFEARRTTGTGETIALYVPSTNNDGVIVLGNDTPIANTWLSVRSQGNDDTTFLTRMQNGSGIAKFSVRDDGLSQFNTTTTQNSGVGGAYNVRNIIADWTSTSESNEIEAALSQRIINTPTVDSTVRSVAARFTATKTGTFEVLQMTGVLGEVLNSGSGNLDNNAIAGLYGMQAIVGNTSTPTVTNAFALRTDTTSQAAGTFTHFGGINIELSNSTNTTIGNMYGIRVQDPVNTGGSTVTNSYILYSDPFTNATNNWGLYLLGANTVSHIAGSLAVGTTLNSGSKLAVRGAGNTNATRAVLVESNNGTDRFRINDDGQQAWGIGTTAVPNAQFAHVASAANYLYGFGFYGTNTTTAVMTVQMLGTSDNGITVATQGGKTGTVTGVTSTILSTGNTTAIGLRGNARNASVNNYGVFGSITGSFGITPTGIAYAVYGNAGANVDVEQHGVSGLAQFSNVSQIYTEDQIGVFGQAVATNGDAASTSDIIGGKFVAGGLNTTGDLIALLVPSTGNLGTVVFGADNVSANASLVEVTGDIEVIGSSNGLILEAPNGTRYRVQVTNAGVLTQTLA